MAESVDLLVTASRVLTMDRDANILENGAVAVRGDRIIDIGPRDELTAKYPCAPRMDEPHGLLMPGLVNTHTHAAMACFRGLADDLPLMEWLQDYIFPAEAKLTGEIVYRSTLLSLCEMIKSGTTSFCDMYLFGADVARAAAESGMRAWIGEVLYDFPSPNYGPLDNGFTYMDELFTRYRDHELVTITVDPHAVYTCSPELLVRLGQEAEKRQALYVIHLSETNHEVGGCREQHGCSPVRHLERLGLLNERVVADHCVVLDEEDIALLARRGVKVAHCPESNMKLASGAAPVPQLLKAGVTVGLGTDGSASNNDVDMFGEMNSAAKLHKVIHGDPTVMNAEQTLRAATIDGAAVLGRAEDIGSLEVGKKADFIVLDLDQPHLTPLYHPASHLVYSARGSDVIHSVINGRIVMRDRVITTLDEAEIMAQMREIAGDIGKIMS